jgi:hypothetical protein
MRPSPKSVLQTASGGFRRAFAGPGEPIRADRPASLAIGVHREYLRVRARRSHFAKRSTVRKCVFSRDLHGAEIWAISLTVRGNEVR